MPRSEQHSLRSRHDALGHGVRVEFLPALSYVASGPSAVGAFQPTWRSGFQHFLDAFPNSF